MSSFGISSAFPSNVTQLAASARTGPAQSSPAAAVPQDTVKLSAAAQAETMHQAGQSVSAIASSLGTSVTTVDSYLGIATTIAVPLTVSSGAHAAPAKAVAPAATADAPKAAVKI